MAAAGHSERAARRESSTLTNRPTNTALYDLKFDSAKASRTVDWSWFSCWRPLYQVLKVQPSRLRTVHLQDCVSGDRERKVEFARPIASAC